MALIIDVFARATVGWAVSGQMDGALVASALKMAVWVRQGTDGTDLDSLTHQNDHKVRYSAKHFAKLLAIYGISPSMGSVGDAHDNALAETMIGSYKTELIEDPASAAWKDLE